MTYFQKSRGVEQLLSSLQPIPRGHETRHLLDLLAADLDIPNGGIGLYEQYLCDAVHVSVNLRALVQSRDFTIIEAFYNNEGPSKEPRYISLYDNCNLNQLQNNVLGNVALVILFSRRRAQDSYQMVYDGRLSFMTQGISYKRLLLYVLRPVKNGYRAREVIRASSALLARLECNLLTPYAHMTEVLSTKRFPSIGSLLGETLNISDLHGLNYVQSLLRLASLPDNPVGTLLVLYRGTKVKIRQNQMNSIFDSHFENIGVICAGNATPTNIERCLVIAPVHNRSPSLASSLEVCQFLFPKQTEQTLITRFTRGAITSERVAPGIPAMNKKIKAAVADSRRVKSFYNEQKKLLEDRALLSQRKERLYETLLELGNYETDEQESSELDVLLADDRCCKCTTLGHSNICTTRHELVDVNNRLDDIDFMLNRLKINKAEFLNPGWPCPCALCQQSFLNQGRDIPDTGPQKRYAAQMDSFEYLRVLGIDTEDNRKAIQECCRLSVATFDIEARTTYLLASGEESRGIPPIAPTPSRADNFKAVQTPIMIGFSSDVMPHDDEQYVYELFDIRENEKDESGMILRFFEYVVKRQKQLQYQKEVLLKPIIAHLRSLRSRHMLFCTEYAQQFSIAPAEFDKMFDQSLPGLFLTKLEKLKRNLAIYGFNSAKYDNQLIMAKLAVIYKTSYPRGRSLQAMMGGTAIKRFSFPSLGLHFLDARFLMAPNASLANFIEMTSLKQRKMTFPHALNTSRDFLLRPTLPANAADWYDPLRRVSPSQKEVNDMLLEFDRLGCKNIGEFLAAYLRLDVVLLNQALQRLLDTFTAILDISAIDLGKSTISSLASSAIQMDLYRRKAPCFVTPSVKPIYEALSNAATGGITQREIIQRNCIFHI